MPLNKNSVKGYLLEEILAYLIRNTGYRLIVDHREDPEDLAFRRGSLIVRGRGAEHQVDVLGELKWIPAFTYPIRLFVEAKFRRKTTGLQTVRNAVGVILDINQKYKTIRGNDRPTRKFHYAYSLFSMSGFSKLAQDMAFAHEVSLIDLSGQEYDQLAQVINNTVSEMEIEHIQRNFINSLRYAIRLELGTITDEQIESILTFYDEEIIRQLIIQLNPIVEAARDFNELFVGMANGPFMLILKSQNPEQFSNYMRINPRTRVTIIWSREHEEGRVWTIRPAKERNAFTLKFRLPKRLEEWIFKIPRQIRQRALGA